MATGDPQRNNDQPIGVSDKSYRIPVVGEPADGAALAYNAALGRYEPVEGATSASFVVTDDAGGGTVSGDANATDYTGQDPVIGQSAHIKLNSTNTFVHKNIAYTYVGPTGVTIGIGGDYIATESDFVAMGTGDHTVLSNRDVADQHPIEAITGLVAEQQAQDAATAQVQTNLDAHAAAADPHPGYALETNVQANAVMAGYGGIGLNTPTPLADINLAWQTLNFDAALITTPRLVTQDYPNDGLVLSRYGIWQVAIKVTLTFAESNSGRELLLRIYNATQAIPGQREVVFFVGRNQTGLNISFTINVDYPPNDEGDLLQLQVSSASDIFTGVSQIGSIFQANHVSEIQNL